MKPAAAGEKLRENIEKLFGTAPASYSDDDQKLFIAFRELLNTGAVRAAEPDASEPLGWRINTWVKKGILLGFRIGETIEMSPLGSSISFFDKSTYPPQALSLDRQVRVVPGGSSIREGCYVGPGVTCMPPMFINAGAYVGAGTMIDSHALIGSCAQIGSRCHISAAAQIGGVLEPVGAWPVIIEDAVLVGGGCGIYEGTLVKSRAVLGSGTILNQSTAVYDLVRGTIHRATNEMPLVIPEEAVVVPGSRAVQSGIGKEWGVALYTPVIVKYRDSRTDTKVQLEDLLR